MQSLPYVRRCQINTNPKSQLSSEIHHLRLDLRSVLHRLAHPDRKRGFAHLAAARASFALCLVFSRCHAYRRQLKHLPAFETLDWHVSQTALTVRTTLDWMHLNILRVGSQRQCMALVPRLAATWLTAHLAQTARRRFLIPITGRWFATVAAVLGQLVFQRLEPHRQRLDRLLLLLDDADPIPRQRSNQGDDSVFALNVSNMNLFETRQA